MGALLLAAREGRQLPSSERTDCNFIHGLLDKRMAHINRAIALSTLAALLVCIVIMFLFTGQLLHFPVTQLVSILFIATMGVLIAGLLYFLFEIRIASRTLRVARHVLKRET